MYAKIFSQIYDGTLCTNGPWEALVTFQQMLILADQDGSVDMTLPAIARRTTIPKDILERGINALMQADPESRTPTEEGRRLVPLDDGRSWGWRVVNYVKYRKIKREEDRREYHREYWHKRKAKDSTTAPDTTDSTRTQQAQPNQPIAEAEAEAEADISLPTEESETRDVSPACPHAEILKLWAHHCPSARQPAEWNATRQALLRARWKEQKERKNLDWWARFFAYIADSDFLMGRVDAHHGRKPFEVSLDWVLKPANFLKIIEGAYQNRERAA